MEDQSLLLGPHLIPNLTQSTLEDFMSEPVKTDDGDGKTTPEASAEAVVDEQQEDILNTPTVSDEADAVALVEYLRESGFIEYKDEEVTSENAIEFAKSKLQETIDNKAKELREAEESSMDPFVKDVREKYREGVPVRALLESEAKIEEYTAIKDTEIDADVDLQKDIVVAYLQSIDTDETEITQKLTWLQDSDKLKDEAKFSLKKLVKLETEHKENLIVQSKAQEAARKQQVIDGTKAFEANIMETKELFDGIPYTDELKKKVSAAILKPQGKGPNGQIINLIVQEQQKNPELFAQRLAFMVLNKWDMTPFKKQAKTEAVKKLRSTISSSGDTIVPTDKNTMAAIKWAAAMRKKQQNIF